MFEYIARYHQGEFNFNRHVVILAETDEKAIRLAKARTSTRSWFGFTLVWVKTLTTQVEGPTIYARP